MNAIELLTDAFGRIPGVVHGAVEDLSAAQLADQVDSRSNSVAWLVWHLSRVQDDHVAEVAGLEQVWTGQGWAERFALPLPAGDTGYGHSAEQVGAVRVPDGSLLTGYHDAVDEQTVRYLGTLAPADLDRVVDERWDPPVTLGARLVSVLNDDLQHAGQAAYLRGLLLRR